MTGTIVKLHLGSGYGEKKGQPITTIRIDGKDGEFTVDGIVGTLGDKVKITAELIKADV